MDCGDFQFGDAHGQLGAPFIAPIGLLLSDQTAGDVPLLFDSAPGITNFTTPNGYLTLVSQFDVGAW